MAGGTLSRALATGQVDRQSDNCGDLRNSPEQGSKVQNESQSNQVAYVVVSRVVSSMQEALIGGRDRIHLDRRQCPRCRPFYS